LLDGEIYAGWTCRWDRGLCNDRLRIYAEQTQTYQPNIPPVRP
jgi:hypothetical protein